MTAGGFSLLRLGPAVRHAPAGRPVPALAAIAGVGASIDRRRRPDPTADLLADLDAANATNYVELAVEDLMVGDADLLSVVRPDAIPEILDALDRLDPGERRVAVAAAAPVLVDQVAGHADAPWALRVLALLGAEAA